MRECANQPNECGTVKFELQLSIWIVYCIITSAEDTTARTGHCFGFVWWNFLYIQIDRYTYIAMHKQVTYGKQQLATVTVFTIIVCAYVAENVQLNEKGSVSVC